MPYSYEQLRQVWEKGSIEETSDPKYWRKDMFGAWIHWNDHGDLASQYGWEVAVLCPAVPRIIANLSPLHWENNMDRCRGRLLGHVTAHGRYNVASD